VGGLHTATEFIEPVRNTHGGFMLRGLLPDLQSRASIYAPASNFVQPLQKCRSGSRIFAKLVFASSGVHRVAWWDGDAEG
jgi:hypothetical protein